MRIFLAGGSGVIGSRLIPALIARGHVVTATTRRPERAGELSQRGAVPSVVDVREADALARAVREAAPDLVVHQLTDLSGSDPAANAAVRVEGTRNLVDAAKAAGASRMIAQSIAFAYAPGEGAAREDDPLDLEATGLRATTVAGVVALEAAVRAMPRPTILRYGAFHGPGTFYGRDGKFADQVRKGTLAAGRAITCFVHVDDAVAATVAAIDWPDGTYNLVDDEPVPASTWVPVFARALGAPAPAPEPGESGGRPVSNARARARGWVPRSWRDGFARLSAERP